MVNNLGLIETLYCIYSVGLVDGMPRAGSHYNLGTSRGPDPARGPCLAHGWTRVLKSTH